MHSEPCQTSKMELSAKMINDFQPKSNVLQYSRTKNQESISTFHTAFTNLKDPSNFFDMRHTTLYWICYNNFTHALVISGCKNASLDQERIILDRQNFLNVSIIKFYYFCLFKHRNSSISFETELVTHFTVWKKTEYYIF